MEKSKRACQPGAGKLARCLPLAPLLAAGGWALLAWLSHHPPRNMVWFLLGILAAQWALAGFVWRQKPQGGRSWIGWGIAFRVMALFALPVLEDDHYRFLWDGRIFAQEGNPYGSTPMDHFADRGTPPAFVEILDRINHPDIATIYGPVCQVGFLLGYLVAPGALWPWKVLLLGADILLLHMLRRLDQRNHGVRAEFFAAWCPLSIFETSFNAHPDALGVSLLVAAVLARSLERSVWVGWCCGAAVGAKVFALLLAPFLLWRRGWTAAAGFAAALLACYGPFGWLGSTADLAGLLVFAREWEFNSSLYGLLAWVLGPAWARLLAAGLFGFAWIGLFWWQSRRDQGQAWPPGWLVFGLFFLLSPTFNPWYALWLVPFVALRPTLGGVVVLSVVSLSYLTHFNLGKAVLDGFAHPFWVRPLEFGIMAGAVLADIKPWRRGGSQKPGGALA